MMPLFLKNQTAVLFMHVPKAGGSSIENLFISAGYDVELRDTRTGRYLPNWYRRSSPQHWHAELVREIVQVPRVTCIFMIVRDPISRFKSEYTMRTAPETDTSVEAVEKWAHKNFAQYASNPYHLDNHLRPQSEFYIPGSNVYRLEDGLDSVVADLNSRFDLELPDRVPHTRSRRVGSESFSTSSVEVSERLDRSLRNIYSSDFQDFCY